MNKDEIKDMVEYCKYSDGCFDCPYNPEDNRSMYALRWYGGCPDCDKELVRAMGKGYRKVEDDEIVVKKSEYAKLCMAEYEAIDEAIEYEKRLINLKKAEQETVREVLQEFAERLKDRWSYRDRQKTVTLDDINETLEEFGGQQ